MTKLFQNIRFYILVITFGLVFGAYLYIKVTISDSLTAQTIKLEQIYGFLSVVYLYIALLATPLTRFFPSLPFRGSFIKARRAIGISAFIFGLLHFAISFLGNLGGFSGLGFLDSKYLIGIGLGFVSLIILLLMASTSFDFIEEKLGFKTWKILHRLVYLAGLLIIIHVFWLGAHFTNLFGLVPQIFLAALVFLFILEAIRLDEYLKSKFQILPQFGLSFLIFIIFTSIFLTIIYFPGGSDNSSIFNIHAQHIQLAKQAQTGSLNLPTNNPNLLNNPAFQGDPTRRFTVSFLYSDNIKPNQDIILKFRVYDANSGNKMEFFQRVYAKVMHLVIVDSSLTYFNHIHPNLTDDGFEITTQFPHDGQYHLYINYQPLGAIEQQQAFTLNIGNGGINIPTSNSQPDTNLTRTFGEFEVTLTKPDPLLASVLSIGGQTLTFTIKDSQSHQPITTLKPYLAAFGHLVMINEATFDYIHVHPANILPPVANSNGGPDVQFLPLGLYGPIKPGVYRVFAQFNPDNNLFTADFTVKIE